MSSRTAMTTKRYPISQNKQTKIAYWKIPIAHLFLLVLCSDGNYTKNTVCRLQNNYLISGFVAGASTHSSNINIVWCFRARNSLHLCWRLNYKT